MRNVLVLALAVVACQGNEPPPSAVTTNVVPHAVVSPTLIKVQQAIAQYRTAAEHYDLVTLASITEPNQYAFYNTSPSARAIFGTSVDILDQITKAPVRTVSTPEATIYIGWWQNSPTSSLLGSVMVGETALLSQFNPGTSKVVLREADKHAFRVFVPSWFDYWLYGYDDVPKSLPRTPEVHKQIVDTITSALQGIPEPVLIAAYLQGNTAAYKQMKETLVAAVEKNVVTQH